jgi:hypothetical protein
MTRVLASFSSDPCSSNIRIRTPLALTHIHFVQSLALYRAMATNALTAMGGYLVEATGGTLLVAFPTSAQAMR